MTLVDPRSSAADAPPPRQPVAARPDAETSGAIAPRPPTGNGHAVAARPRSPATPPPDPAEALYYEGMAAYQHRNWEQALERFGRLKALQPNRPGLDALLDEVRWFLQLQAAAPVAATDEPGAGLALTDRRQRTLWPRLGLVALAIIGIAALLLFVLQGRAPWRSTNPSESQDLLARGQARLTVGDYEGAEAAFRNLLTLNPDDTEAQRGLARAQQLRAVAQAYAAAEAAIAEEDWARASNALAQVIALDPGYSDAQAKVDFVTQRMRLATLYEDGSRLYDLGQWAQASAQFELIKSLDSGYRAEAVAEFLFVCYLNAGDTIIREAVTDVPTVSQAVDYYARALTIHPRNRLASQAHRQSSLFLAAVKALAQGDNLGAQTHLEALLAEDADYGHGAAAHQLYELLLQAARAARQTGDFAAALSWYAQAQTAPVADVSAAQREEAQVRAITPTPTPSPTPTPIPHAAITQGPINLRSGPDGAYASVARLETGATVQILGRNADGRWLYVCVLPPGASRCPAAAQQGWLSSALAQTQGELARVPVLTTAAPTRSATPRPATATPSAAFGCLIGKTLDTHGATPLAGWSVTLTGPDRSTRTTLTNSSGGYRFGDLAAGAYTVNVTLPPGWRARSPQPITIAIAAAPTCAVMDFWYEPDRETGAPPTPER